MKVLAITNQKGGVGKTTLAIHLAHAAAESGLRVLLIDTDEADLSEYFGVDTDALPSNILRASQLYAGAADSADLAQPVPVADGLWYIPADDQVKDVDDMELGEVVLMPRKRLERFRGMIDLVIIDAPPNLQRRMMGALAASDAVVTPLNISAFTLQRLPKFMNVLENIRHHFNPGLTHLGLIANLVNSRSTNELEGLQELRDIHGNWIFPGAIFSRACIPTSIAQGKPVWHDLRPGANRVAAAEIRAMCNEILTRMKFQVAKEKK